MCPYELFYEMLLYGFIGSFLLFSGLWIVQVIRRDAGVVDIGWTAGVGAMAIYAAVVGDGWLPRRVLLGLMGGVWAFRLVAYILRDRILREREEDGRYQRLRAYWGKSANAWFYLFFTSQSLLVVLFGLAFLPAAINPTTSLTIWDVGAVAVWLIAMGGEWLADWQLTRFRRNTAHRGKVCEEGLWNYSRHPNYFFEWLHWWAYVLLAIGVVGGWLALVGPILMYLFLIYITGIPHVEKQAVSKRGEAYRTYQKTTSMFIPLPKRSAK